MSSHISAMSCHWTIWWSHMWLVCVSVFFIMKASWNVFFLVVVVDLPFTPLHVTRETWGFNKLLGWVLHNFASTEWLITHLWRFPCLNAQECLCTASLLIEQFPFICITLDLERQIAILTLTVHIEDLRKVGLAIVLLSITLMSHVGCRRRKLTAASPT